MMSRGNSEKEEIRGFVPRFIEACGTSQPAEIKRLLNISYQAAKNYLHGRLPDAAVLIAFSHRTGYSIHWLLTGQGEKLVSPVFPEDKPLLTRQIEASVRVICVEVINEMLERQQTGQSKVVVLHPANLLSEKADDVAVPVSNNKRGIQDS